MILGYMVNTENTATQYRTGDELHYDYLPVTISRQILA